MCVCLPVSPQFLHHVLHFLTPLCRSQLSISFSELSHVHFCKLLQGESPAMQTRTKPNCTNNWVDLKTKSEVLFQITNILEHFQAMSDMII